MKRYSLIYSLRIKIMIWFALMLMAMLFISKYIEFHGVPFTKYEGETEDQRTEEFNKLNLLADLKKERLERWLEERRDDITVLARSDMMKERVRKLREITADILSPGDEKNKKVLSLIEGTKAYKDIFAQLNLVKNAYGVYDEISVVDMATATVLASTKRDHVGDKVINGDMLNYVRNRESCYIDVMKDGTGDFEEALYVARCMSLGSQDRTSEIKDSEALVIMHVNSEDFLLPMLHSGAGLGETGEALLVNQDVKILMKLKHPLRDLTAARVLEYEIKAEPAVRAARGEDGIILTEDYRDKPVLAAYRYIPISAQTNWGMVVKRDKEEVFALFERSRTYTFFVVGVVLFIMLVFIWIIAGRLTRPVRLMRQAAQKVRDGDFSVRVPIT